MSPFLWCKLNSARLIKWFANKAKPSILATTITLCVCVCANITTVYSDATQTSEKPYVLRDELINKDGIVHQRNSFFVLKPFAGIMRLGCTAIPKNTEKNANSTLFSIDPKSGETVITQNGVATKISDICGSGQTIFKEFKNGLEDGETVIVNGSTVWARRMYSDGQPHGKWRSYYSTGELKYDYGYSRGKLHGDYKYFHRNGALLSKHTMQDGKRYGDKIYYHKSGNGEVFYRETFINDNADAWKGFYHAGKFYPCDRTTYQTIFSTCIDKSNELQELWEASAD